MMSSARDFNGNSWCNRDRSGSLHDVINFPHLPSLSRNRMVSSTSQEEYALLGMPGDSMDDIELRNIRLQFPLARTLSKDTSVLVQEDRIETPSGTMLVASTGDKGNKPVIITYHDIGLNHVSCFQSFFNFVDSKILLEHFAVYHINAPGQEENAETLTESYYYEYPSMDRLAEMIGAVVNHFKIKSFVGLGVGAGANILSRYAIAHPEQMDALIIINCSSTVCGWVEWGYQKMNAYHLKAGAMTQGALDYLMWHHFGQVYEERNQDLMNVYRHYFEKSVNPFNLGLFMESYMQRTDLEITRELDIEKKKSARMIRCPVLSITGNYSPHTDDTVVMNGRLDPENSNWMKLQDCGMVLEEQPEKVAEAIRLFLQGLGYVATLSNKKLISSRAARYEEEENLSQKFKRDMRFSDSPINEAAIC